MKSVKKFLLLRFAGNMFFGCHTVDNHIKSGKIPPKTLLVGLLGNALGYDEKANIPELESLQERLDYAVRIDQAGTPNQDYQTADIGAAKTNSYGVLNYPKTDETVIKHVESLVGGMYLVAVSLDDEDSNGIAPLSLEDLLAALIKPSRVLFFGRKSNIPALPIALGIFEGASFEDILSRVPQLRFLDREHIKKDDFEIWKPAQCLEDLQPKGVGFECLSFMDEYDYRNSIRGGQRFMIRNYIKLQQDLINLGKKNFDFLELGIKTPTSTPTESETEQEDFMENENEYFATENELETESVDEIEQSTITEDFDTAEEITTGSTLYEIVLKVDARSIRALSSKHKNQNWGQSETDSYEHHVLMACLFGKAVKTYQVQSLESQSVEITVYSYLDLKGLENLARRKNAGRKDSTISLRAIDWQQSFEKNKFESSDWELGQKLSFEIVLPTVKKASRHENGIKKQHFVDAYESHLNFIEFLRNEPDGTEERLKELSERTRQQVYADWFAGKLKDRNAVRLEKVDVVSMWVETERRKAHLERKRKSFDQVSAHFVGSLIVADPSQMNNFLFNSFGKGHSFGDGMLKIVENT